MERVREIRKELNLTQGQLASLLTDKYGKPYTTALISYVERGLVQLPKKVVRELASECPQKPFRNRSDEGLEGEWITIPSADKKPLKSAISANWSDRGLKQTERVLAWLEEQGSITTKEAFDYLGIARLASRIHDLKEEGYEFERTMEHCKNRFGKKAYYIRYKLRDDDGSENMA